MCGNLKAACTTIICSREEWRAAGETTQTRWKRQWPVCHQHHQKTQEKQFWSLWWSTHDNILCVRRPIMAFLQGQMCDGEECVCVWIKGNPIPPGGVNSFMKPPCHTLLHRGFLVYIISYTVDKWLTGLMPGNTQEMQWAETMHRKTI